MKSQCMRQLIVAILLMITPMAAQAYEEVDDLVEIFVTDSHFTASINGQNSLTEAISPDEYVIWQGSKGEVGAILTNQHFLAVSVTSEKWSRINLKSSEKEIQPEVLLAAHIVVMMSGERMVSMGPYTGGLSQTRMPVGESVVASDASGRVAVVVTPSKAFGFSANRGGAAEIRFSLHEDFVSLNTSYTKGTIQTSDRVYTFIAKAGAWRKFKLK